MSIASMAISLIYPTLKPTLEASIRKITVNVNYSEGNKEKSFTVVQYITNPQLFSPDLDPSGQAPSGAASEAPSSSPPSSSGPGPKGPLPSRQGAGK